LNENKKNCRITFYADIKDKAMIKECAELMSRELKGIKVDISDVVRVALRNFIDSKLAENCKCFM
jgi:hypothetical protein